MSVHPRKLLALMVGTLCFLSPARGTAQPVDPGLVLSTMRDALSAKGPLAERVRVTIKPLGKPSRTDEFLLKIDPGKRPDQADAAVWLELGDLRIYAAGGTLVAVHTGDVSACYSVEYGESLGAEALRRLLPPIPAPLIGFLLGAAGEQAANVSVGLTPYTPRITWTRAEAVGATGGETVTIQGVRDPFPGERPLPDDTRVTLVIDAATSRPSRFVAMLPDASELRLDIVPTVPGNPATWRIRTENRSRVMALTDLREREGDAAVAHTVPDLNLIDANWNSWEYRSVFRERVGGSAAPTHLALVFVRENVKDAFGAPSPDAKACEDALERLASELNSAAIKNEPHTATSIRLVYQVVPVMLTMDDGSRRKVENAVKLRAGIENTPGRGAIVWAPTPERTIDRFAPGAAAVCVVIRADNSLAGIILLDGRSADRAGITADLRRVLGLDTTQPTPVLPAPRGPAE